MGTRIVVLMFLGACWRSEPSPRVERPRMIGVHCDDIALRGATHGPGYTAFVAKRWDEVVLEIGTPIGTDADMMRAYFRVSWATWMLGDAKRSTTHLARALDRAERPAVRQRVLLDDSGHHEVLACLVGLFATETTIAPDEIRAYMAALGGEPYANDILRRLAEEYVISGRTLAADRALALVRPRPPRKRR